jgi:hypothetical protein
MTPPQAAGAKEPVRRHAAGSGARAGVSARRVALRVVGPRRRGQGREPRRILGRNPSRVLNIVSVSLVLGSLLAVVVGQALLANGQVRLSGLQGQLTLEQSSHRNAELAVAELETPSRIVAAASAQLHMVRPAQVIELPYVSLSTPLATPKVMPAATATAAPATTAATGGTATGGAAQTTTPSTP